MVTLIKPSRKINILSSISFLFFLVLVSVFTILNSSFVNYNYLVLLTFFLNGSLFTFDLLRTNKIGYSLKDVTLVFFFIFMFLTPLIQYLNGIFPWWTTNAITTQYIIITNIYILIFYVFFSITYYLNFVNNKRKKEFVFLRIGNIKFIINFFLILTVISTTFIILNIGFFNLFSRSTYNFNNISQTLVLIVSNTFRSISVFFVGFNLIYFLKKRKFYNNVFFVIGFLLMVLVNFPLATARFWTATIFIGFLIISKPIFDKPYFFKYLLFAGLFLIFPFLNLFRYLSFFDFNLTFLSFLNFIYDFTQGDFDAYSMLTRAIIYVDQNGTTNGYQLLGPILFFIPRSLWPNKPIGSGSFIATFNEWIFTNVSMPFIGEGVINFGLIGLIIFSIILGFILSSSDYLYISLILSKNKNFSFIEVSYPFTIGFLFFILRGDLLSSSSFFLGFMIPIIIVSTLSISSKNIYTMVKVKND
jgi:hypothetical protein